MTRITGQQARELLDGTTRGPWEVETMRLDGPWDRAEDIVTGVGPLHALWMNTGPDACLGGDEADHALAAAAPDLAETVAWLYGRGDNGLTVVEHLTSAGSVQAAEGEVVASVGTFSPDEAVDLARALLAAAEEARRDQ